MKKSLLYPILLCFLFLISCAPEKTEMWFDKKGAGKVEVTIDIGDVADIMMETISSMGDDDSEEAEEGNETDMNIDMWGGEGENVDSLMNFYDIAPDSVKQQMQNPELLKHIQMHMKVNKEEAYAKVKMMIDFKSPEHFEEIMNGLDESMPEDGMNTEENDLRTLMGFKQDLKSGTIMIDGPNSGDEEEPYMQGMIDKLKDPANKDDPEFMDMMRMMFGGESKTVVHTPGNILFTNDSNAEIEGNTVTFRDDILQLIIEDKRGDKVIKYEK